MLFPEVLTATRKFTNEQFGILMRAAFSYRFNGEVYSEDDAAVDVAFQIVANQIDRYQEYCETLAKNAKGSKGEQKSAKYQHKHPPTHSVSNPYPVHSTPCEDEKDTPTTQFSPPTVDEVAAYCKQQEYDDISPQRFVSYYQSVDWMKGRTPITNWQAAVDSWHRKDDNNGQTEHNPLWTVGTTV